MFFKRLLDRKTVCIRRLANNRTEAVKFERWIRNKHVTLSELIRTEQKKTSGIVSGRHVLGIQDTTEINFQKHAGRVHGLGTVGNGKDLGFFMHPMLVLDAETTACLGYAAVHIENRLEGALVNRQKLPIEDKESYRWISTAQTSKRALSEASCVTFIGDRENDIYEFIARIPDEKAHIITRARHDRPLENGERMFNRLERQAESGRLSITISGEPRKKRVAREAVLSVRHGEVEIKKPKHCLDKTAPETIKVRVVEAQEVEVPLGQTPVFWRLLTTHEVSHFDDAKQIIKWYQSRWNVEQVFRTLKRQGLDIESSQVESVQNLMKLAVIALSAAIQIMQLVLARDGTTGQATEDVFGVDEQIVLSMLLTKLEGKTTKQKNPHLKKNLAWATWIIARLGGWQGYRSSEGPPGPITLGRGLAQFQGICYGVKLSKDLCAA
jgi:hypothetical protein